MTHTVQSLEKLLGSRENFIINSKNRRLVKLWAERKGMPKDTVASLRTAELANLYHTGTVPTTALASSTAPAPAALDTDTIRKLAAEILVSVMSTVSQPINEETVARMVQAELERNPDMVRKIEITTPTSRVVIDAPVHYMTETVLKIAALGHSIMLVGPAGCGKTTIAEHAAKALNLAFYITSAINENHELIGFVDGYGKYHSTPFRAAFEHGGLWVADEIDAWDANALLTANSALANGFCRFPDSNLPVRRHSNFRVIATANTFGNGADRVYVGRNELDAASTDRFATLNVDYDLNLETLFSGGNQRWLERVWEVRKAVAEKRIRHVVSSRAIIMGAQALAAGLLHKDVEQIYLFKGMSAADRAKIDA